MADNQITVHIRGDNKALMQSLAGSIQALQNFGNKAGGAMNNATKSAKQANTAFGGLAISMGGLLKMAGVTTVLAATAIAVKKVKDGVVGLNSQLQNAGVAFTNFLKSAEASTYFLDRIQDFAADTPFDFPQVVNASQKLLGLGWAAKKVIPDLTAVGDAVAGTGGGTEQLQSVIRALGQIKNKGKVSAEELNQLAEANIPAQQILAEKLGLTGDQIANIGNEGIEADKGIRALIEGMGERYKGMMDGMSKTFTGAMTNIQDNTGIILAMIGKDWFNGLNKMANDVANFLSDVVKKLRSGGVEKVFNEMISPEWQARLKSIYNSLASMIEDITPALKKFGQTLGSAFGVALDFIAAILRQMAKFFPIASKITTAFWEMANTIIKAFGKLMNKVVSVFEGIQEGIADVIIKVHKWLKEHMAWAYDLLVGGWDKIGDGMFSSITEAFEDILSATGQFVRKMVLKLGPLGEFLVSIGDATAKFITDLKKALLEGDKETRDYLQNSFDEERKKRRDPLSGKDVFDAHTGTSSPEISGSTSSAEAIRKAQNDLELAKLEAALLMRKAELDAKAEELERDFKDMLDGNLISIASFYDQKRTMAKQEYDAEMVVLNAKLNAAQAVVDAQKKAKSEGKTVDPKEEADAEKDLAEAKSQVALKETEFKQKGIQLTNEENDAVKELNRQYQDLYTKLLEAEGKVGEARKRQIKEAYTALQNELEANGEDTSLIDKLIKHEEYKADLAQFEQDVNDAQARMETKYAEIDEKVRTLQISSLEGERQKLEAEKEFGKEIEKNLDLLLEQAKANKDEAEIARLTKLKNQIQATRQMTGGLKGEIKATFKDGLTKYLEEGIAAGQSFGDTMREVFNNLAKQQAQMYAQMLAQKAVQATLGALGFATGGYISGPGTGTSDSIPARLSDGEYVIRAASVNKFGKNFFDMLNYGIMPSRLREPRKYASGGLVSERQVTSPNLANALTHLAGNNGSGKISIVNVHDSSLVKDYMESSDGATTFINVIEANRGRIKRLLG